jgi:prepilin-type N-terminal cleavage/methylation domain-containing protein/prepilin-type processing-associated H-X9-DG protein
MSRRAFSLIELLVVIAIVGILIALIAPALEKANERARNAVCGQNLHQIAVALTTYGSEYNNAIPTGPATPSALDPSRAWNIIGSNQLWIAATGQYNGLAVLTTGGWMADAKALACPSDDDGNLRNSLPKALGGPADVYGSYAYRQLDQRGGDKLSTPGNNAAGNPARALAMDWQSAGPAPFAHNSHDSGEYVNTLYSDGHVQFFPDDDFQFGGRAADYNSLPGSYLHRLDQVWVNADWAESNPISTAPVLP